MNLIGYNSSPKYSSEIGRILVVLQLPSVSDRFMISCDDFVMISVQEFPNQSWGQIEDYGFCNIFISELLQNVLLRNINFPGNIVISDNTELLQNVLLKDINFPS